MKVSTCRCEATSTENFVSPSVRSCVLYQNRQLFVGNYVNTCFQAQRLPEFDELRRVWEECARYGGKLASPARLLKHRPQVVHLNICYCE